MRIGLDIGGTNLAVGIVDDNYEIIARDKRPTLTIRGRDPVLRDIIEICESVCDKADIDRREIKKVGMGCPGAINFQKGRVAFAGNLPLNGVSLRDIVAERWSVPVTLENDANAAALGETLAGAAKGVDTAILVTLGTGVGGGIVIDRKIFRGFNGGGGEIGHEVIVEGGVPCTCGRLGCWEAYSSATGLVRMTRERMAQSPESMLWSLCEGDPDKVGGRTAFTAAKAGDPDGAWVVSEYIRYLACGVANMVTIFQPEILCIGGGVAGEGDYLLNPLKEIVRREAHGKGLPQTELKIAALGNDAGIIGAAFA